MWDATSLTSAKIFVFFGLVEGLSDPELVPDDGSEENWMRLDFGKSSESSCLKLRRKFEDALEILLLQPEGHKNREDIRVIERICECLMDEKKLEDIKIV